MKVGAVNTNLPDGDAAFADHGKPNAAAIRRKAKIEGAAARNRSQLVRACPIGVSQENICAAGESQLPSVAGPCAPLADHVRQTAGSSRRQR
jgi:hypothetical protein